MRKRIMGLLLSAAMVISSMMPAMPVIAAEDTFPLGFGKWLEQRIENTMYYTFNMPGSGRVRVSIESDYYSPGGFGLNKWGRAALLNSNFVNMNDIKGYTSGQTINIEDEYDLIKGKYIVRIYGSPANIRIKADFTSAEESFPETESSQNNSQSRANEINLNKTYKGQLAYNDSSDYYKFIAPQNTKYKLSISYLINETHLTIKDSWGRSFLDEEVIIDAPGTWTNYENELTLPEGEYYFSIEKPSGSRTNNNNGNYTFTINTDAKPVQKPLNEVSIENLAYTGKVLNPEISVTDADGNELTSGTDYTVKYSPSTVKNAGTYKATVTGIGKYTGTKTVSFKVIAPQTISYVKASSLTYTGKSLKGKVTVIGSDGNELTSGTDYTVTYSPKTIKAIGTYKATVKGKGDYTGSKFVSFNVNPKGTSLSSLKASSKAITVNFMAQKTQTDGYYIQYSTDKSFKTNTKKVTVSKSKTSYKLSKLTGNKKYYVRVATYKKVNGKTYTSSWSAAKSVTTKK